MATLLAHIRIRAGSEGRFEQLARDLHRASHGSERGLRRYEYWRGEEPGTYYSLLSFEDYPGFLAHQTSSHHEAAGPALREVMEVIRLEWVDPVAGAAPLVPTETAPLAPGATELERTYHERFAAVVQEWWQPLRRTAATDAPPPDDR